MQARKIQSCVGQSVTMCEADTQARQAGEEAHRKFWSSVIDALEFQACSTATRWEGCNVTVGGDAHSAEEGVHASVTEIAISTGSLHLACHMRHHAEAVVQGQTVYKHHYIKSNHSTTESHTDRFDIGRTADGHNRFDVGKIADRYRQTDSRNAAICQKVVAT